MSPFSLSIASIRARRMQSFLCALAAGAGVALLCAVFLLSRAVETGVMRNAEGIDVVVGAKGSPLQLVLSTVYHADVPTGNIDTAIADKIAHNPQVRAAIPLALGDNYRGNRIVGTTPEYIGFLGGTLAEGKAFNAPFEAVAGAATGMKMGEQFAGAHGFSADSDDVHDWHLYNIVGVLKPTGTVLDRLILTSVKSVQELHMHPDADDPDAADEVKIGHQVTALLLRVKSPIAVMTLPRQLNGEAGVQAASPAYEMTRLSSVMGVGRDFVTALGLGFVALSALMLLSALASSLTARRYDLGVLRVLGAPPVALFATVIYEGVILSLAGTVAGIVLGHLGAFAVAGSVDSLRGIVLPQALLAPSRMDAGLLLLGTLVGLAAGAFPAIAAARTDIAGLLARGRA